MPNLLLSIINEFEDEKTYLSTSSVNGYSIDLDSKKISFNNRETRANMEPSKWSVWFAKMKNSKKFLNFSTNDDQLIASTILSTGFFGVQACLNTYEYTVCVLDSEEFEMRKDFLANGATQEAISQQALEYIPILTPPDELLELFHKKTGAYFELISHLLQVNYVLKSYQKKCLEGLISGEIELVD